MNILQEADKLTSGAKREAYGKATDAYQRIAAFWSIIIGHEISMRQVGLMMVVFKIAREMNTHQRDNLVDIAGYARTLEMLDDELREHVATKVSEGSV